ncbi:unnamed protein product [Hymenolepis diminuta]|uniref:Integrase catalytic domain-containing protein n=1 Tax=Hymenolepis diminuta TaxID=6216 RepID=A0A564XUW4_HYMDI|nr:unnamed protein product [Hymenolepis diminuta]
MLCDNNQHIFSTCGLPEILATDNYTQFSPALFQDFHRSHNIIHVCFAPNYSQSNGEAERFVDTLKGLLQESNEFDFDGRTWVRLRNRFRSRYTTKSPQLETVPLDIVLDVSDLPPFGNNEIPHIRPSNQQNLHCEHSRKSPKKFRACPTFKSYNENVLQEELDKSTYFSSRMNESNSFKCLFIL